MEVELVEKHRAITAFKDDVEVLQETNRSYASTGYTDLKSIFAEPGHMPPTRLVPGRVQRPVSNSSGTLIRRD